MVRDTGNIRWCTAIVRRSREFVRIDHRRCRVAPAPCRCCLRGLSVLIHDHRALSFASNPTSLACSRVFAPMNRWAPTSSMSDRTPDGAVLQVRGKGTKGPRRGARGATRCPGAVAASRVLALGRVRSQAARVPPSTGSSAPFTKDASSEARKATALATSAGRPTRPRG